MANPFGSADQALEKNTGHANQANLTWALIPRTVNKWREVITGVDVTPGSSGAYDSDGFWGAVSGTAVFVALTLGTPEHTGIARTLIVGIRHNGAGGGSGTQPHAGLYHDTNYTSNSRFFVRMDHYARQYNGHIFDGSGGNPSALTSSLYNPGNDTSAVTLRSSSAIPVQNAYHRVGSTNTSMGSATSGTILSNDSALNRLGARLTNKWSVQYIFVYDTVLSDTDVDAIIDNPAGVIQIAGGGGGGSTLAIVERGRAFGRGLGRGIF